MSIDWSQLVTAEDKAECDAVAERAAANNEARAYLAATDWYVIRLQETDQPIPEDITLARSAARAKVVDVAAEVALENGAE